jgi:Cft2 family RNA processing exonuclease
VFPPASEVVAEIIRFCRAALAHNEIPVLLCYSLGKSQELLCSLADSGLEIMVHESILKVTKVCEELGQRFPEYEPFAAEDARGKVLLCPPSTRKSAAWGRLDKTRTAVVTGWAVDSSCRYRYQCDAAFPLSDHADFPDLVEFVERIEPRKVFTLHGFATDFAETLRDLGFDAQALGQDEQLTLPLFGRAKRV